MTLRVTRFKHILSIVMCRNLSKVLGCTTNQIQGSHRRHFIGVNFRTREEVLGESHARHTMHSGCCGRQ